MSEEATLLFDWIYSSATTNWKELSFLYRIAPLGDENLAIWKSLSRTAGSSVLFSIPAS